MGSSKLVKIIIVLIITILAVAFIYGAYLVQSGMNNPPVGNSSLSFGDLDMEIGTFIALPSAILLGLLLIGLFLSRTRKSPTNLSGREEQPIRNTSKAGWWIITISLFSLTIFFILNGYYTLIYLGGYQRVTGGELLWYGFGFLCLIGLILNISRKPK